MNTKPILDSLNWSMEQLPFPALFLYLIALGLLWLFVEAMVTRSARATPGWRKPVPILPAVSEVAAWTVRGSSWLLWTWTFLYFALAAAYWASTQVNPSWAAATETMTGIAGVWRQTYVALTGFLPPFVVQVLPGL